MTFFVKAIGKYDRQVNSPYKSLEQGGTGIYLKFSMVADEIHEQEVFGRPRDYDTSADDTVRVHVSVLRKRVDQYFAKEGSNESIIIEIPRGITLRSSGSASSNLPKLSGSNPPLQVRRCRHHC
jgi:hypothetical protein